MLCRRLQLLWLWMAGGDVGVLILSLLEFGATVKPFIKRWQASCTMVCVCVCVCSRLLCIVAALPLLLPLTAHRGKHTHTRTQNTVCSVMNEDIKELSPFLILNLRSNSLSLFTPGTCVMAQSHPHLSGWFPLGRERVYEDICLLFNECCLLRTRL